MSPVPPRLLTIAGSDSGGGAGIQADLKTFAAHGAYGMSVVTAITAQNTCAVTAVHSVPPEVVRAQIDAVFDDIGVDGVKIGMLGDAVTVLAVADALEPWLERSPAPVVLDPVMVAKSGAILLEADAVAALTEQLLPLATVVTPNLPEAVHLTGRSAGAGALEAASQEERRSVARQLAGLSGGTAAVLLKGGHGEGEEVVDILLEDGRFHRLANPRIETRSTHGTGCTLSSALAAQLAVGVPLAAAFPKAVEFLRGALLAAYPIGAGSGPVDHLYRCSTS